MKLNMRGEKHTVTDAMKNYALEKLLKLDKYLDETKEKTAIAVFKVNGPRQKVEITIPLSSYTLRVEESGEDFYAIIDIAVDKLERQIRKNKTRINSQRNKSRMDFVDFDFEDVEENNNKIVKRKTVELKPMNEEEAILQMELLSHDFYIFKNTETDKVTVIYRRKNNDYGLIEEE